MKRVPTTVEEVVKSGLCTGCGLCASMAGEDRIEMGYGLKGHRRPLVRSELPDDLERQIMEVCPGANLEGPGTRPDAESTPLWGPIRKVDRSWAADEKVRFHGAGGGTLTALADFLLASGQAEAILHVKADPERPWLTVSAISRTSEEVWAASQSRYGASSPLERFHELLESGVRFAVIGKPCDISAVSALRKRDPRVRRQVTHLLTIFCGGTHHSNVPRAIMRYHKVPEHEVEVFRYRGEGWPGPLRVQTKAGETHDMTYLGAWTDRPWTYDMQFRCKICIDAVGEVADVSVPDGWIMRNGKPLTDEAPGTNIAVARTAAGEKLLAEAQAAGYLTLAPMTIDELKPMHANHIARRLGGGGQLFALTLLDRPQYRVSGYGRRFRFRSEDIRLWWAQFKGTMRRARAGENREPAI